MNLGKKTEFMLYSLGKFYLTYNSKFSKQPIKVAVSKKSFIGVLQSASITKLSERMIYKHLEMLEKKKLVKYGNRRLEITDRGRRHFLKIQRNFEDYFNLGKIFIEKDLMKLCRKSQTFFIGKD